MCFSQNKTMRVATSLVALATFFVFHVASAQVTFLRNRPPPPITPNPRSTDPILNHISMKVDNFNSTDIRTWNMRYYSNSQHFKAGGPIFIFLGGEWDIDPPQFIQGGQIYDMAEDHGAYLFYTEHRYYGKSYPTSDFTTANLKYLSVDQALADVASFIRSMKSNANFANSKVVVVGGSYSGMMATWGRMKYPGLIDAAYASSAPLVALDDFKQYFEVVGRSIYQESPQCWNVIKYANVEMDVLYYSDAGRKTLDSLFQSCSPFKPGFPHKDSVFNQMANLFGNLVQGGLPGQIKAGCDHLLSKPGTYIEKYAAFVRESLGSCMKGYDEFLALFTQPEVSNLMFRPWCYQTCTEFGFFSTANSTYHLQPFGLKWFTNLSHKICADAYGPEFTKDSILKGIDTTNTKYGGLNPNITKVISIHGSYDPWHPLGLLKSLNSEAPAILIDGTSHCADLLSISASDTPPLRNAKQAAKDYIAKWIS